MFVKRYVSRVVAGLLILGLFAPIRGANSTATAAGANVPDRYIVVLQPGVAQPTATAQELARAHGLTVHYTYSKTIKGFAATIPAERLAEIQANPAVAAIAADREVRLVAGPAAAEAPGAVGKGGHSDKSKGRNANSQALPTGIDRIDGEQSSARSGNNADQVDVDVAVIDTGIDADHPDLNVAGGTNCTTGATFADGNGHGTHVAGTIGALDNNIGVVGVAPGARLWAVRVLDNFGTGTWSSIICGVEWVTANADTIEVANMSLAGNGVEPDGSGCDTGDLLHEAICESVRAGVTYVAAAGNRHQNARNAVPAAYDEVITVSALADFDGRPGGDGAPTCQDDADDTFAAVSSYGADIDIIAPGVCITSTWNNGGYSTVSGTSMATAHVTGAAALYKASHPHADPDKVKRVLLKEGTSRWDNDDDPDDRKEPLLNVEDL